MRKTIEGLCAVFGAFLFAYLTLGCIKFAIVSGYGELLLCAVPMCLGVLICLMGLIDSKDVREFVINLFAGKEDEL